MTLRRRHLLLVACLLTPALAPAGPGLTNASPSADSVAQGTPSVVELTFSEPVQPKKCRIAVKGPDGKRADGNDTHIVEDPKHLAVSLKAALPGRYVVDWHVVSVSAQKAAGSYSFTITP
jgi:methionine-rich copper-binding protein CopC